MDRSSQATLVIATTLLLFAIASPFLVPQTYPDDFVGFFAGMCFFVVFFIVGLTVLVVGLGRSARHQQQQQVVVLGAGGVAVQGTTATARVRCPNCEHLNLLQARFCTQCAAYLGSPQ